MGPMSYEGPEKYIFVSYAHRDSQQVMRILESMSAMGYRLWYDDGIAPGSEWPEDIASHLDGCAVCVAFISNNSMASANCRREVNFALSRQKPFLGIVLEPTTMSLGMEMQLSSQQCILRYNYQTDEAFLRKVCTSPDLQCCKAPQPVLAEPAPVQQPVVQQPVPVQQPASEVQKKKNFKPLIIVGAIVLSVVLLSVLISVFSAPKYISILPGVEVRQDETSLLLSQQHITPEAMEKINSLQLYSLHIQDCTVEGDALSRLDLPQLRELSVVNSQVPHLGFLENHPELDRIELKNCGLTDDLVPQGCFSQAYTVELADNAAFTALDKIALENIWNLNISGTGVTDLSCMVKAVKLSGFDCSNTKISSIEPLAELEELLTLECDNCPITQVTAPFMSLSMQMLDFDGCPLQDATGLENCTVLHRVYFSGCALEQVQWLAKSTATLKEVYLAGNPLEYADVAFLKDAVQLTRIDLSGIALGQSAIFENMTELTHLYATSCQLTEVSRLGKLNNLQKLHLDNNQITDLQGMPAMEYGDLNLAYNQIADISPLAGKYSTVALQGNPVVVTAASFAQCSGSVLVLDYDRSMLTGGEIPFDYLYLSGCPADQRLTLEDAQSAIIEHFTPQEQRELLVQRGITYSYPIPE